MNKKRKGEKISLEMPPDIAKIVKGNGPKAIDRHVIVELKSRAHAFAQRHAAPKNKKK